MVDSSDETGKGHVTAVSERLDEIVERLAARTPSRQAIVAVENGDRSFRWARALGEAPDGAKVRVDSPFFIASIDKLYNATLVLKLSEDGRVDLDEPISAHLPTSITNGLHRIGNVDYSSRISVRHLLGHTSGLADWLEDRPKGGPSLVERVLEDGDVALGIEDIARIVREELKPHFPPRSSRRESRRFATPTPTSFS